MEQKTKAANLLKGKKDRRAESKDRKFEGDYMHYDQNYGLQNALGPNKDERVVFADQVLKVNRRMRIERRDFILSVEAFYLIMRANRMGQQFYKVSLRVPINNIKEVVMSTLQDNFIVFVLPTEDVVIENDKKTELLAVLLEHYQKITGNQLMLRFTDTITYKLASGDQRTLQFSQDQSTRAKLKKSGKSLRITICAGIGKDADTAPKGLAVPTTHAKAFQPKAAPFSGGGTSSPFSAGAAAQQQAHAQPAQQAYSQPAAAGYSQPPAPVPPPTTPSKPKCRALFTHQGQSATELSFQAGDIIEVLKKDPGGWWEGELNGKRGWVPHNYVQEL